MRRSLLLFVALILCHFEASAFSLHHQNGRSVVSIRRRCSKLVPAILSGSSSSSASCLCLVPIRKYSDKISFLSESDDYRVCIDHLGQYGEYELGLVEEPDLPDVSRFIVRAFGADAIRLSQDVNAFEKMLMTPAMELVNGYSGIVAFAEVLAGLRSRLSFRFKSSSKGRMDISPPNLKGLSRDEKIDMAASTSLVLALAKKHSSDSSDWHSDVVASVELRLEPCDAKIPFSFPWIDRIERRMGSLVGLGKNSGRDLQPYLSNLCVDESVRGKGVGRALVRVVENIASTCWGFSRMYLHVDPDNEFALKLYKSEGYKDVGLRWNPFWAGKAKDIGYYYKKLESPSEDLEERKSVRSRKEKKKSRES